MCWFWIELTSIQLDAIQVDDFSITMPCRTKWRLGYVYASLDHTRDESKKIICQAARLGFPVTAMPPFRIVSQVVAKTRRQRDDDSGGNDGEYGGDGNDEQLARFEPEPAKNRHRIGTWNRFQLSPRVLERR